MADISLPSDDLQECRFTLVHSVASAMIGRGVKVNVTEIAPPSWRAEIGVRSLDYADTTIGEWSSMIAQLRGGLNAFLATDITRKRPFAYPSANAATDIDAGWDGTAGVSVIAAAGTLTLTDLPAGYVISKGDRIGLEQTVSSVARYGYHEVISGDTADGSGEADITVSPFIKTGIFTTEATARLWRPVCRFIIDPEYDFSQSLTYGSIAFSGMQRI